MRRRSLAVLAPVIAFVAACGGKSQSASPPAADTTTPPPAPAIDSVAKRAADSASKPAVPQAPKAKPAGKPEMGDHDVAIRPKFKIDEKTGKVDPIKRP